MKKNNIIASALVFGSILVGSIGYGVISIADNPMFTKNGTTITTSPANAKLDVGTLSYGNGARATSTDDTSATFLATDFDVESYIEFTPNVVSITASLPASTTLLASAGFLPNAGDCRPLTILNSTTTAGASFTLAGGTGSLLRKASSTAAVLPGGTADMTVCRKADTDIVFSMSNNI